MGVPCHHGIENEEDCKEAAESNTFEKAQYVVPSGAGHDLPVGCILDQVTIGEVYIYYNQEGHAISEDPMIQPICVV